MSSRAFVAGVAALLSLVASFATAQTGRTPIPPAEVAGAKPRDLVYWGVKIGADDKGLDSVIREFERRHPDIKVRLLSMGAGGMNPQKLMTSIVGNVAPDLIAQDRFTISDWASRGAFRAMDDLIARDANDPLTPKREQYYEAPWDEAMYNGELYAIPTGADNRVLYWNKKIFRQDADKLRAAGLDPERPPRTWSELLAYSKALTKFDSRGNLKQAGFMPNFGNSWLYMYAFQNDADFMSKDGKKCTMANKYAVEALDFIVKGYDIVGGYEKAKSFESGFRGNENDPFVLGQVAMKIDGDWVLNGFSRYAPGLDFNCAPPPVPDARYKQEGRFKGEDQFITWVGGFSLAIPRGAKNVNDAWTFIKFATSTEGRMIEYAAQAKWEQLKGRTFIPRQLASREANEEAARRFSPASPNFAQAIGMHTYMAQFGRIRPATFVGQLIWNEHVRAMEAACYKKQSSLAALTEAQANVQRELDAYFNRDQYSKIDLSIPLKIGIGIIVLGVIAFGIWFSSLKLGKIERNEARWAYLFILPWIIGFLGLTIGPMMASLFFSFTQWDVLNEARWVGIENYRQMFLMSGDWPRLSKSLGNAAYLAGVGVPLGLFTGLAIALLLNAAAKGMRFYRTIFYMPAIIPGVASAVLWTWVLTPDSGKGLLNGYWANTISAWFAIDPPAWLQSADWSKPALIVMGMWGAGSGMVLWLAGLKGVSPTLYEAASLDGADPKKQFWTVTFPTLSPIVFFNTVMGFIGAMQEFDRMYIMKPSSDGPIGPDDSLLTPVYHLFTNGFTFFKMGYASALAWLIFGIIMLLTFTQFRLAPRWVHYEADK